MVFKPPVDNPTIVDGAPFPNIINQPPSVSCTIQASADWLTNNPRDSAAAVAEQIVMGYEGAILQAMAAARQQRQIFGARQQRVSRQLPGLLVQITFNNGLEDVRLTVQPENVPVGGPRALQIGGLFDVNVPFTGFPMPSMGASGGTTWATAYVGNPPLYPFDPAWTPNDPGLTTVQDPMTGLWKCASPILTPDLNDAAILTGLLAELFAPSSIISVQGGTNITMPTYVVSSSPLHYGGTGGDVGYIHYGVPEAYWCNGVGGSAILTQPLQGQQYWEVEIVKLPSGKVPDSYVQPSSPSDRTVNWPLNCDSFGTPLIGVCPGYYLPDDQTPADPTKAPKKFQDYVRPLGCDPFIDPAGNQNLLARSIYLSNVSRDVVLSVNPTTYDWLPGVWEVATLVTSGNQSACTDYATYYAAMEAWDGSGSPPTMPAFSVGANAWLPICFDNPYVTVPGWANGSSDDLPAPSLTTTPANIEYSSNMWIATDGLLWSMQVGRTHDNGDGTTSYIGFPPGNFAWGPGTGPPSSFLYYNSSYPGLGGFQEGAGGPVYWDINYGPAVGTSAGVCNAECFGWAPGDQMDVTYGGAGYQLGAVGTGSAPVTGDWGNYVRYTAGVKTVNTLLSYNIAWVGDFPTTEYMSNSGLPSIPTAPFTPPDTTDPQCAQDLWLPGHHAAVYIGRADDLHQESNGNTTFGDGATLPLDGSLANQNNLTGQTMGNIGQFTGVDLGDLREGDRVMVATDTATGYVWFGLNGVWYRPPRSDSDVCAPISSNDGPAQGTLWTAVMDGFPRSATPVTPPADQPYDPATARPQYFPAVGWRVGPMEVKIHYGVGMKYPPPGGFQIYGGSTLNY